ncbi:MAG: 4-alpha-glucanotransferase [Alphaproteobacteria bacterium]|nr:4-alpha-glucanotransferase [Alphaproteobacteria bacterium]
MSELLHELANTLNISTSFTYTSGGVEKAVNVSDDVLKFFIKSMGYDATDDAAMEASLAKLSKKRWQRVMEAVYVVEEDDKVFDIVLKQGEEVEFFIAKEDSGDYQPLNVWLSEIETYHEGRTPLVKFRAEIKEDVALGYYDIMAKVSGKEYKTVLAVAPKQCYALDKKGKEKLFGFALQLYALKSRRNWGVGDFTDLANMVDILAQDGGDIIGLNPLSVLEHDYPEQASPYASVSRLFLNPIYIDVTKVPYYEQGDKDEEAIKQAKEKENIDYTTIYNAKMRALKNIFVRVNERKGEAYYKAFEKFVKADEGGLHCLAVLEAINSAKKNGEFSAVEAKGVSSFAGRGIKEFVNKHKDEINFFKFLQFEADRQLKEVYEEIKKKNMAVGLYRDLPVGVSQNSAEVWNDKYLYMQKSGAGAPPDNAFPTGQKWGLGAFNPFELKERCYKPFIRILRANMKYAGAVRIDHIMGLSRLYVIPNDKEEGTYIRYNEKDMLNILALESYLNRCVVVGECIGNVEGSYRERLTARNIYSLGVLWCEHTDDFGTVRRPHEFDAKYVASIGTHDMPPLKAWWFAVEQTTMKELGMLTAEEVDKAYHWRDHERKLLLEALDGEGVWPQDNLRKSDYIYGEGFPEGLEEAVHAYMAKTNSEIFIMQPEDIFLSMKLQNLPGTDIDKYPNWRSRVPVDIEDMASNDGYRRILDVVKKWR